MNYGTQAWCDWRNSQMQRRDVEWVIDGRGGCYLRDHPGWAESHGRALKAKQEDEQRRYMRAMRNPVQA